MTAPWKFDADAYQIGDTLLTVHGGGIRPFVNEWTVVSRTPSGMLRVKRTRDDGAVFEETVMRNGSLRSCPAFLKVRAIGSDEAREIDAFNRCRSKAAELAHASSPTDFLVRLKVVEMAAAELAELIQQEGPSK